MQSIHVMLKKYLAPAAAISLLTFGALNIAQAGSVQTNDAPPSGWFVAGSVGFAMPKLNNAVAYAPGFPDAPDDQYISTGLSKSKVAELSAIVGYQWGRDSRWFPAFSVDMRYSHIQPLHNHGVIAFASDPRFINFGYQYRISQHSLMFDFKADVYRFGRFMPFVSAGAGLSVNKMRGYSVSALPGSGGFTLTDHFLPAKTKQFAYSVGAGVDYLVNKNIELTLGYRHNHYGMVRTGYGTGPLSSSRVSNKLSSNTVYLQAGYIF